MEKFIVVTSINPLTCSVRAFRDLDKGHVLLVGDQKSIFVEESPGLTLIDVDEQAKLGFVTYKKLPFNHYSRKNLGYLYAIQNGAEAIYETDDDNAPMDNWEWPEFNSERELYTESELINIFSWFSSNHCWPRGFPLSRIKDPKTRGEVRKSTGRIGIWQGLVSGVPDVDAIYRLAVPEYPEFQIRQSIHLARETFSPFNSQNTFWSPRAYPLMYLPAFVNFRFTDILRGYVAQRILWDYDLHLGFSSPDVFQDRNEHDLIGDFENEIQVYISVEKLIRLLLEIEVEKPMTAGLCSIYKKLYQAGLVIRDELDLLELWCEDIRQLTGEE